MFDWTILKYQQSQTAARTPPLQSAGDAATAGASASRDVRRIAGGVEDEHDRLPAGVRGGLAADPARRRCVSRGPGDQCDSG